MAVTKIHGGMDETITSQLQFTSQMSDYALVNHTHNFTNTGTVIVSDHTHSQYLTTAALSNHNHTVYLTTAALSNHSHTQYAANNHSHSQYSPTTHLHSQYITSIDAHSHTNYLNISDKGTIYFEDANNITFGSKVSLMNTTITASVNAVSGTVTFNTNHTHTNYINISESGNVYFKNENNIVFGSIGTGASTIITASAINQGMTIGNLVFLNSNGHTFASSTNSNSTFYWIQTI